MLGTIKTTVERQEQCKIGRRTTMLKYVNQCYSFEHTLVLNRQPMELLYDGCNMSILLMICDNQARVF